MSLTADDLSSIRAIVSEESRDIFRTEGRKVMLGIFQNEGKEMVRDLFQTEGRLIVHETVKVELSSLEGKVTTVENDVKEIYFMLARIDKKLHGFHKHLNRTDLRVFRLEKGLS